MDTYTVIRNGEVLFKGLSEEEYMDLMEDFAIEYYQTGSPKAGEIETIIIGENGKWQKQKRVWTKAVTSSANPKKLVKEVVTAQNTPRRLVMVPRKHIADKDGKV